MDELRERLKKCKEELGISYKALAKKAELTIDIMYKFSSGTRDLSTSNYDRLDSVLREFGY